MNYRGISLGSTVIYCNEGPGFKWNGAVFKITELPLNENGIARGVYMGGSGSTLLIGHELGFQFRDVSLRCDPVEVNDNISDLFS